MRSACGILSACLLLAVSGVALAADPDPGAIRSARARFEEGMAAVRAGRYDEARLAFTQARAVIPSLDILWNLALAEEKSGHAAEALGHFRQFERDASSEIDRAPVKKHIEDLAPVTGHFTVSTSAGAQIYVDGVQAAIAPLVAPIDVSPGRHGVEARIAGAPSKAVTLDVAAGQTLDASLVLDVAPGGAAGGGAGLAAGGGGGSAQAQGTGAPGGEAPAPPAGDRVASGGGGGPGMAKIITVAAIGGTALIVGGIGLGFGVASNNDANQAATLRQQNPDCSGAPTAGCQQLASTTSAQHNEHVISTAMLATGGGLLVAGVVTWFLWPNEKAAAAPAAGLHGVRVLPSVGAGSGGLTLVGSF
jgi:tetratricopeptide (TPR) repeat protein